MTKQIAVGEILRPVGIRGEVKIKPLTDDTQTFLQLKSLYIDGQVYDILRAYQSGEFVVCALKKIADRDAAELLRTKIAYADKSNVALLPGRYFISDLIGCNVITSAGENIGKVQDIKNLGAADIITVQGQNATIMFPHLIDVVLNIDIAGKTITVDNKRFFEVCVEN